jgi:site-specific recombinase XerD
VLRVRDWNGDEVHVSRAAKDRKTGGLVRGLKSRNIKTVPAHEWPLRDWLEEHVSAERRLRDPDGPLFANPDGHGEGWWSEAAMRRTWAAACKAVGVSDVSLYEGTKHSTATHLKALGADDRLLAQLMGHRDARSIEKYAKLGSAAIRAGLERLYKRGRGEE